MNRKFLFTLVLCLICSFFVNAQLNSPRTELSSSYSVHNIDTGLNYAVIQEAVNANETLNGHTIRVDTGTYYEHIIISKQITLVGENRDATVIDGNGTGTVVVITASYVNISNFTIQNAGRRWPSPQHYNIPDACIRGSNIVNASVKNNTITGAAVCVSFIGFSSFVDVTGNRVHDSLFMGIMTYSVNNATICDNLVHDFGYEGIHLDGGCNGCKIAGNTVIGGAVGISLERSGTGGNLIEDNMLLDNNASIGLYGPAQNVFRRNNMTSSQLTFLILGYRLDNFMQDIDDSNLANGKKLYYLTNRSNLTVDPSGHPDLGYLALVNCTKTIVRDLDLSLSKDGLVLAYSTNCTITNVTLWGNHPSLIWGGLMLFDSTNNTITTNKIGNNSYGTCFYHSDANVFCHNCFVDNDVSVVSDFSSPLDNKSSGQVSQSIWDNGLEGNFWSNHTGADLDHNGIGDAPYVIDANNTDHYPLMGMFSEFNVSLPYGKTENVAVVSNSTVSNLSLMMWLSSPYDGLQPGQSFIQFTATGENGSVGFCRLTIPRTVLNSSSYIVLVDSQPVNATELPTSNDTCVYLYFTYPYSAHEVIVTIPEFSWLIFPLFMMPILLAVILHRRKRIGIK